MASLARTQESRSLVTATIAVDRQQPWGFLVPYQLHVIDVWSAWRSGFFLDLVLWLIVVALLLVSVAAAVNSPKPTTLAITALVAVAATVAAGNILSRGRVFYEPGIPAFEYACSGLEPEICVHPAFERGADAIRTTIAPLTEWLAGTPGELVVIEQRPRGVGQEPRAGASAFHLDGLTPVEMDGLVPEMVFAQIDQTACQGATTSPESMAATDVVASSLITGRAQPIGGAEAEAAALNALTPEQRAGWFEDHWENYRTCRLVEADFS
ncbi:MAG: hypothetical protein WBM50_21560 [Acidimicrobiales bacterium]